MSANIVPRLWPVNRQFARVQLTGPFQVTDAAGRTLEGVCRDISEEGISGSLLAPLQVGTRVWVKVSLPDSERTLHLEAMARHVNGALYGFRFVTPDEVAKAELRKFVARSAAAAFLLSPDPSVVREIQQQLQAMGMPQASLGAPKTLPVTHPHLVVIDADWPDYLEVIELLRAEATHGHIVILVLIGEDDIMAEALAGGADLVLSKPLDAGTVERVLRLARQLVMPEAETPVAASIAPPVFRAVPFPVRSSGMMPLSFVANHDAVHGDFSGAPAAQRRIRRHACRRQRLASDSASARNS